MIGGEKLYRDFEGALVQVSCARYHGPAKIQYFCYQPYQARTLKELRQGVVHVGCMIPNGNIWEYPLSAVEIDD